jgi:hypothetical protein
VSDREVAAQPQFGRGATNAVGAAGGGVHLADNRDQQGVADSLRRRRPLQPVIVSGLGDILDPATHLHHMCLSGHLLDGRVPGFRATTPRTSPMARFVALSSASSAATRFFAAASSTLPSVVKPCSNPRSIRSWRRQL